MKSLSVKADEAFVELLEPIKVALQFDATVSQNKIYTPEELNDRVLALWIYAITKGKILKVDLKTMLVMMENP